MPALHLAPKRFDTAFAKRLVALNVSVPALLLLWDTYHHQLGANGVNYALHTTGLMALLLLILSLAVTPLRTWTGVAEIISIRRTLGLSAFYYLCAHFMIFVVFDRAMSLASTWHEILTRRYLQIGTIALLLFIPLAVTSTQSMVMRLGAKRWKALHRLTYVASTLAAIHYYLLVKADVRQPLAFAGVLALLLATRPWLAYLGAGKPKARAASLARRPRFWSGELEVLRIVQETHDVRTFRLGLAGEDQLPFDHAPGQYLTLSLIIDGQRVQRSYTIASAPMRSSYVEITVKRAAEGRVSRHLHDHIQQGAKLGVRAPAGRFVFTGEGASAVLLIAGGVGITPLMSIVRYLTDRAWTGSIVMVISAHTQRDLIFASELADLERLAPNLRVVPTLSGEDATWPGRRGRLSADLLREVVPHAPSYPVYLCGPEAMMAATRVLLSEIGISSERIFTEDFQGAVKPLADAPSEDASRTTGTNDRSVVAARNADDDDTSGAVLVQFRRSKKAVRLTPDLTLLEGAEDAGLDLPFECRSGICGQCKMKLLAGRVTMEVQDALSAHDKDEGYILSCQARAVSDVEVDA